VEHLGVMKAREKEKEKKGENWLDILFSTPGRIQGMSIRNLGRDRRVMDKR